MNNFSFSRFKNVVVRDFHLTYQLYGLSMLILMCVPVFLWLFGIAFKIDSIDVVPRTAILQFVIVLSAALSSTKIYKSCNLAGRGNYFAMLPASLGEKFCSMMLYCFIITPLAVFVGSYAIDTLLTLLPFGPYNNYLWYKPEWLEKFQDIEAIYFDGRPGLDAACSTALKAVTASSVFMFANTIFKKNKFIKTILWIMLISFVASIVLVPIVASLDLDPEWVANLFENWTREKFIHFVFWGLLLLQILVIVIFSFFTYRRLKKMQY